MPQLVKGGKYVFGWSKVNNEGKIVIPPEAFEEYQLSSGTKAFLLPGSKSSGGFVLTTIQLLQDSPLKRTIENNQKLANYQTDEGKIVNVNEKPLCWVKITEDYFIVPPISLKEYGVDRNSTLLSVRGSNRGLSFLKKGLIIEEAKKHPEIKVYE
ncbi:MAG: hypothetical protein GF308_01715 [Candidatus Heimdallarchaeota archaeon]|nr:hypothetical protein [Candidatus Heimdallarchaeota archaeon]